MFQFKLPDLGEGIAEAEIVELSIQKGDAIESDQVIGKVMTDKAVVDISSPQSGQIADVYFSQGDVIKVGDILFEVDTGKVSVKSAQMPSKKAAAEATPPADEKKENPSKKSGGKAKSKASEPKKKQPAEKSQTELTLESLTSPKRPSHQDRDLEQTPLGNIDAVPFVREFAKKMGVRIELVHGTGPGGRVMKRDIENFLNGKTDQLRPTGESTHFSDDDPDDWDRQPLQGVRRAIADKMTESKTKIPHFTFVEEVDMSALDAFRRAQNGSEVAYSPLVYIANAVGRVLPDYPSLNASLDDRTGEIIYKKDVHLGIAVDTPTGLIVPVLKNAGTCSLRALSKQIKGLADGARNQTLKVSQVRGSTFTISSLGKFGGVMGTPIINYPESAILGVHRIRKLPRFVDGKIEERQIMNVSVSVDHRIADGLLAAKFVLAIKDILESADFPGQ